MTDSRLHQVLGHLHPSPTSSPSSASSPTFTPGLPPGLSPEVPKRIPGPWHLCHPVNGHGRVLLPYMQQGKNHLLMREWRDTYGPVFGFVVYEPSVKRTSFRVVVAEPAEARRLLKLNPPKPAGYQTSIILGEGVLSNTDPVEWARQRNLLKPVFSSPALKELMPVLTHGAQALVAQLREDLAAGRPVNIHEELSAYAFLMIGHSALGEQDEFLTRRAKPLREAFNVAALKEVQRININKDGDYRRARDEISSFTHETFQRYEEKQRAGCPAHKKDAFITIVMGNDAKGCPHMNQKQREDELSTFMFAGHETTAHTMSWAILELARNPQYQKKLQAELDSFIASIGGLDKLEYKDLFKLEYLSLVVNETLRLWPVVANGTFRILDESTEVAGVLLPKDTVLNFPHFLIHRDKKVWGEDADKFVPGRKWFPDSFIPFTVSPRDCLGRNLAMMEMRIILINVFYHFDVTVEDPNLEYVGFNTFTLFPEHGVWVNLHQRSH